MRHPISMTDPLRIAAETAKATDRSICARLYFFRRTARVDRAPQWNPDECRRSPHPDAGARIGGTIPTRGLLVDQPGFQEPRGAPASGVAAEPAQPRDAALTQPESGRAH